jgi:hypothetical protein
LRNFAYPIQNTIQDSTVLLRSLSYHSACGNNQLVEKLKSLISIHPKFSKSIVLTASIEARKYRLELRKQQNPDEVANDDLLILTNPDLFISMENYLIDFTMEYFNAAVLDTSELNPHEVANKVRDHYFKK